MTDQEKELLQSFEQARIIGTRPRGGVQVNRRIHIPVNRTIVLVLIGIFFSAMVFSVRTMANYTSMHKAFTVVLTSEQRTCLGQPFVERLPALQRFEMC